MSEIGKISDGEQEMILAHRTEQAALPVMKEVREMILKTMIETSTFIDKKTNQERTSNKVDMTKFSEFLNKCNPESNVRFSCHWRGGLFVDYGNSKA